MTEADLENLLEHAARRLRFEKALRAGFVALGAGLLISAFALFVLRLVPVSAATFNALEKQFTQLAIALPLLATVAAMLAVYLRFQPKLASVALLLDRRAGSDEHLVTWYEFRTQPAAQNELLQNFRAAQRAATLQRAAALNASSLLPIRLPDWSRVLWLALLLLCCALLMPPRIDATRSSVAANSTSDIAAARRIAPASGDSTGADATPHVQPLPPTELLRFQLMASDAEIPAATKAEALKALLAKLGNLPESELAPEVRDILNALRSESAAVKSSAGKNDHRDGTQQLAGKNAPGNDSKITDAGVPAAIPELIQKAISSVEQHFPDVREPLERYYGQAQKSSK